MTSKALTMEEAKLKVNQNEFHRMNERIKSIQLESTSINFLAMSLFVNVDEDVDELAKHIHSMRNYESNILSLYRKSPQYHIYNLDKMNHSLISMESNLMLIKDEFNNFIQSIWTSYGEKELSRSDKLVQTLTEKSNQVYQCIAHDDDFFSPEYKREN